MPPNPRVLRGLRRFARAAGVFAVVVPLVVLLGWAIGNETLKSLVPGQATMKINTAIGLALCGLALLACQGRQPRFPLSGLLSLAVLLLGLAIGFEFATGVSLGIDTLFHPDGQALVRGRIPGRMSELTATSLVLLGVCGLAVCSERGRTLAQAAALLVVLIGLYAMSTFGYQVGSRTQVTPFFPVAIHTAMVLLVLSLGWLAARPEEGLMRVLSADSLGGALARRALLPSLLIPSLLSFLAQRLLSHELLSPQATLTLLAVASGSVVAWLVWSVSTLMDRIEGERRMVRSLREDANTDPLTRLGNRRAFQAAIDGLARQRREEDRAFSLLMIDVDRFKAYNDSHGHPAGDEVLRLVGRALQAALRPGDVAARYGGEEFTVLLPGIDGERALRVAERIRQDLEQTAWPYEPVTVSIGAAQAARDEAPDHLVARADAALYQAKRDGRNRVVLDA
ncbi:MAG TPA: GGDEF domain-containing protein [Arenimonas sp.]|uniref:GGDEF domain-containing protein n=1 Tax=Arenimonas sp. TaxID=1872635 RepID=UPI002D7EC7C6|nr:GGDEF domain-containing protein [Arenimonas sp.]HEU0152476.1 GGDEF domain-containing protein [Arenimonas sp.]